MYVLRAVLQTVTQILRAAHQMHGYEPRRVHSRIIGFFTQAMHRKAQPMSFHYERMRKVRRGK